jgi:hypothetical protein
MFHVKAVAAAILALSLTNLIASADDKGQISDAQMTCAATVTKEYLAANDTLGVRATVNGLMSVDDTIAQRRLVEGFCKRWAACLVGNLDVVGTREMSYRATFLSCLDFEAKRVLPGDPTLKP